MKFPTSAGRRIFLLWFALAVLSALPAWGQSPHEAKLLDAAKKERSLVWYTAMSVDAARPVAESFEKKYGFLKVNYVRLGTVQMINRITTETLAGKWEFDAVTVLGMDALVKRNIFAPYLSPEREAFVDDFKDPKGLWTGVYHNNVVLAYNTKLVAEKTRRETTPTCSIPNGRASSAWMNGTILGTARSRRCGAGTTPIAT